MILDCAECGARYLLADRAIGPEGRQVRCARCGLGWFANPTRYDLVRPLASLPPGRVFHASATMPTPKSEWGLPGVGEITDALSQLVGRQPTPDQALFRPRYNPARLMNWLAAGTCAALLLASAVVLTLGNSAAPASTSPLREAVRPSAPVTAAQPLEIMLLGQPDLTVIASGSTLFVVSARIRNPTARRTSVPDIVADLENDKGDPVYSWTIHAPRSVLGPGESIDFDTSQLDVPAAVRSVRLGFIHRTLSDPPS